MTAVDFRPSDEMWEGTETFPKVNVARALRPSYALAMTGYRFPNAWR